MKHLLTRAVISATALLCGITAWATPATINFDSFDTMIAPSAPLLRDGDYLIEGSYYVNTQAQVEGSSSIIARLSTGSVASSCVNGACPGGSDGSQFLSLLSGGILHIGKLDWSDVSFTSLSAAAITTAATPTGSTTYLVIEADRDDGSYASFLYALTDQFTTITSATAGTLLSGTGTLGSGTVTDLYLYTYVCNGSNCSFLTSGLAVDNILLDAPLEVAAAVPEPSSWLLMAAGLGAVGVIRRRL